MASRSVIIGNLEAAPQIPLLRRYDMARRAGLTETMKKVSTGKTLLFMVNRAIPRRKAIGKGEPPAGGGHESDSFLNKEVPS